MVDWKKIGIVLGIIWLVIMIALWSLYPFLPGDIFMWMLIATIWTITGGSIGAILIAVKSKRNLLIVCLVWVAVLVILWVHWFYPYIPGIPLHWYWITIVVTIGFGILVVCILTLKLMKKTQW